jgi:hypothetical protein
MDSQPPLAAEDRLAQILLQPLFAREATWAEIVDELDQSDELESRRRPAPRTLQSVFTSAPRI